MAPDYVVVAKAGDIREGEVAAFSLGDAHVAVANVSGTFYAFGDTCTHAQCSLAEGELEGTMVICGCYGSVFDVTTGAVLTPRQGAVAELRGPGRGRLPPGRKVMREIRYGEPSSCSDKTGRWNRREAIAGPTISTTNT